LSGDKKDTKSFPKLLCFTAEKCKKGLAKVRHFVTFARPEKSLTQVTQ
jgi:hypothetical protein